MARRKLLNDAQRTELWAPADDEREIIKQYTFSQAELSLIEQKYQAHNRIGFAVMLCYLRFPGRPLGPKENPPEVMLEYISKQIHVPSSEFAKYRNRDQTRREHLSQLMAEMNSRHFTDENSRELQTWLLPIAQNTLQPTRIMSLLLDELRKRHILLPPPDRLEKLCVRARKRADTVTYQALTQELTKNQRKLLDGLLKTRPDSEFTQLTWLRQVPHAPAGKNILLLIKRLLEIRELGIPNTWKHSVPRGRFERLSSEGLLMTTQNLGKASSHRRQATLT